MILLAHAYSRSNEGDGLLVDATIRLIRDAVGSEHRIVVGAMHADTFRDLESVIQVPGVTQSGRLAAPSIGLALIANQLGLRMRYSAYDMLRRETRLVVGVGGGYLRSGTCVESIKTAIGHMPQMAWATSNGLPTLYMPQSVGPFRGPVGAPLRSQIAELGHISLRDDRSMVELGSPKNADRSADLAVMKLFEMSRTTRRPGQLKKIFLIARDIRRSATARQGYIARLRRLRELLPEAEVVLQSTAHGNNDASFCREIGWKDELRSAREALLAGEDALVISVRLHGSLQALVAGAPSIHLSYERKGYGAYQDLSLDEYVHSATDFDPDIVASQARTLLSSTSSFWDAVDCNRSRIMGQRLSLVNRIRETFGA